MGESRTELISWLNELLAVQYNKVEQCGTGACLLRAVACSPFSSSFFLARASSVRLWSAVQSLSVRGAGARADYSTGAKVLRAIRLGHVYRRPKLKRPSLPLNSCTQVQHLHKSSTPSMVRSLFSSRPLPSAPELVSARFGLSSVLTLFARYDYTYEHARQRPDVKAEFRSEA